MGQGAYTGGLRLARVGERLLEEARIRRRETLGPYRIGAASLVAGALVALGGFSVSSTAGAWIGAAGLVAGVVGAVLFLRARGRMGGANEAVELAEVWTELEQTHGDLLTDPRFRLQLLTHVTQPEEIEDDDIRAELDRLPAGLSQLWLRAQVRALLEETGQPREALASVLVGVEAQLVMGQVHRLDGPWRPRIAGRLLDELRDAVGRLRPGQRLPLSALASGHMLLVEIERTSPTDFAIEVLNTGEGAERLVDATTGAAGDGTLARVFNSLRSVGRAVMTALTGKAYVFRLSGLSPAQAVDGHVLELFALGKPDIGELMDEFVALRDWCGGRLDATETYPLQQRGTCTWAVLEVWLRRALAQEGLEPQAVAEVIGAIHQRSDDALAEALDDAQVRERFSPKTITLVRHSLQQRQRA